MKFSKLNCSAKFYSENNDSNLMKVKLMIVHPGRNRNYSSISKETINDAMESVKNIPILGYVKSRHHWKPRGERPGKTDQRKGLCEF